MKKLLIVIVALLILGAVAFGVRTLGARDETDAVDSKDAAQLVTDDAKADAEDIDPGERPEAGTYTYTGSGHENVDALGGSEHVFPEEIPIVVQLDAKDDCAWTSNVVYVKQHIEERRYCTKSGVLTDLGFTRETEFFNQTQETVYDCDDKAFRLRTDWKPGDSAKWVCTQAGGAATSSYTATLVGEETIKVGGESVKTWHTKVVSTQTGDTRGGDTSEFWLTETGLIVKFTTNLDVKTKSVLGDTRFQEQTKYVLTSLVPEQEG
jgi:hypothetical protein